MQSIHIICLVVPSEDLPVFVFRSKGPAKGYYELFCQNGRNHNEFLVAVRGAAINKKANEAVAEAARRGTGTGRVKDALRGVSKEVLKILSKHTMNFNRLSRLTMHA